MELLMKETPSMTVLLGTAWGNLLKPFLLLLLVTNVLCLEARQGNMIVYISLMCSEERTRFLGYPRIITGRLFLLSAELLSSYVTGEQITSALVNSQV